MKDKPNQQPQPKQPSRYVRMKRGGVIQSVPKDRIDEFKKMGFIEV
jgi:hypothetical protein